MKKQLDTVDQEFIQWAIDKLGLESRPRVTVSDDHEKAKRHKAMGYYDPAENIIWTLRGSRVKADWYRTLGHELVHWRQREKGQELDGGDGSDCENEANSTAAVLLREFGRDHPEIYSVPI